MLLPCVLSGVRNFMWNLKAPPDLCGTFGTAAPNPWGIWTLFWILLIRTRRHLEEFVALWEDGKFQFSCWKCGFVKIFTLFQLFFFCLSDIIWGLVPDWVKTLNAPFLENERSGLRFPAQERYWIWYLYFIFLLPPLPLVNICEVGSANPEG